MNTIQPSGAFLIAIMLGFAMQSPLAAQSEPVTADVVEDCTVVVPLEDGDVAVAADQADSLTDVLTPCAGVLVPKPVGDSELTIEPTQSGETPVIEPEDIPVQ